MLNYKNEDLLTAGLNISRLIEKTVFSPFSQEIKEFLVHISLLDTSTLEQAGHMRQKENIEELLQEIVGRNAFISRDEKTGI